MEIRDKIFLESCKTGLPKLPSGCVDVCVTSPPYFGLRDYGHEDQIGLEKTPEDYVASLVQVFTEVKRVLKNEGTLWLNLGDSYAGSGRGANSNGKQGTNKGTLFVPEGSGKTFGLKPKDLIGIPWMVAFALRSSGWYLRQDIIWAKPNPMPESMTDRCTKAHEYIFLLSKSANYYFDQHSIKVPMKDSSKFRLSQNIEAQKGSDRVPFKTNGKMKAVGNYKNLGYKGQQNHSFHESRADGKEWGSEDGIANKRSVWTVATKPFSDAHFATFPEELIVDMIKAGCPEFVCDKCGKYRERIVEKEIVKHENWYGNKTKEVKNDRGKAGNSYNEIVSSKTTGYTDCGCNAGFSPGIVLDPFCGAGTTPLVAKKLNRSYLGYEINPDYLAIAQKRLYNGIGMFL